MGKFKDQLDYMASEEIDQLIKERQEKYDIDTPEGYDKDDIGELFELMHSLQYRQQVKQRETYSRQVLNSQDTSDLEQASRVFHSLEGIIAEFRENGDDLEHALDYQIEWTLMAIQYNEEVRSDFTAYPIYRQLFDDFDTVPEHLQYKLSRVKLQLAHHYQVWLDNGGEPDVLDEDEREFLEDVLEGFEEECEAQIEAGEEREDWECTTTLKRSLYRYYLANRRPNDAIAYMKLLAKDLPNTEDYHEADLADLYMELGQLFKEYRKYKPALKYFEKAKAIFDEEGEDLEIFAAQAESWIDEVKLLM